MTGKNESSFISDGSEHKKREFYIFKMSSFYLTQCISQTDERCEFCRVALSLKATLFHIKQTHLASRCDQTL